MAPLRPGLLCVALHLLAGAWTESALDSRAARARSGASGVRSETPRYRDQPEASDLDPAVKGGQNNSRIVNRDHGYYTSRVFAADLWVDVGGQERSGWSTHGFLSGSLHERVKLSFAFPFYGHLLTDVTVAAGGFVYTGEATHSMLSATQYIAPLMADFDPGLSDLSSVFYFDNGSALVVQWSQVRLRDDPSLGAFTFQAALLSDGRMVFAYREVPVRISSLEAKHHPVKVGVSDAFVVINALEQIPDARRRTIYEYHKVDVLKSSVSSRTAVELRPLPSKSPPAAPTRAAILTDVSACLQFSSCAACASAQIGFNCSWCGRLQRCSSGFDRHRQEWVDRGCPDQSRERRCLQLDSLWTGPRRTTPAVTPASGDQSSSSVASNSSALGWRSSTEHTPTSGPAPGDSRRRDQQLQASLLALVVMVTVVVVAGLLLSLYMYHHPTSSTSIFFMERRPVRWPTMKFKRGSGHPSYAEVEAPGPDRDSAAVIDPKQCFVMADRRESEQKEGFIVPDQRERFLGSDSC
ncbi:plexin domain-containing protein 2 [Neosynchiropus ocellatus]